MKKIGFLLSLLLLFAGIVPAIAQIRNKSASPVIQRCATQEALERRYLTDPVYRAMMEQRERDFQQWRILHPNGVPVTEALSGPVTIPVVVHVVLPNPNIILESDIEYLINRLNLDFSGLNPDSTNGVLFYGVRGHSLIRFCLAKRDPSGNFTNGIERRTGAGNIGAGEPQAIKSFASGGLNPWNTSMYYNIWVGQGGGLLGIAPEIGPGTSLNDGVCINFQALANNPCYTIGAFNLGRTAVHEIGHNFGLWHTFQGGCANQDMQQLTSPGCTLPGSILSLTDDTPGHSGPTSGCPSGGAATGCAGFPNPPGKQYQNYMDYTDDACYSMFTKTQVERMHWITEFCRAGYLTSNGCQLPASIVPLDAAVSEIVSPGGTELVGCTVVTYSVTGCSGTFAPKIRIQNQGSTTLTSVTVQLTLNGTPLAPQTLSLSNIAYGKSQVVTLSNATLITGPNTLSFTVSAPNGGVDGNATNNTLTGNATYTPPATAAMPLIQDFVGVTFPPANLTISNPNSNVTWVRNANGNGNAGSAFLDNYNFNLVGQVDELRSILITVPTVDSVILTFDLAHKNFPGLNDRLQVLVSSDCGSAFTASGTNPVFDRSGATLATAGASTANYTTPVAADWRNQRVAIFTGVGSPFATSGNMIVSFRATNGYGNNIFLDNINISPKVDRDLLVSAIIKPTANECGPFAPQVTVRNDGAATINSYNVGYIVDNNPAVISPVISTPIAPGATANYTFPSITVPGGSHTFRGFSKDPVNGSGTGDQNLANDTLSIPFAVATAVASITEDFVPATFPPANWRINNPNANNTWVRNANGNANAGSMFIDNYNFNLVGQIDESITPPVTSTGAASVVIGFDLAHKNFPGLNDRLQVLYSTDCGATWLPTSFDRSGATLATAGSSTANYTTPAAADWVRQTVSINTCSAPVAQMMINFRMTNGYGNNIFIDNVNVAPSAPTVTQPANQVVCNGSPTTAVTFAGTATTYNWTNNTPSIGLAASGSGNIASFNAVNTGTTPVVATITVTPSIGACTGTPASFTITVNPTPTATATPPSQSICTGIPITTIVLSGTVAGTTYSWIRNNTATVTGIPANGTGNISGTLTNTTTAPVTVTFTITPAANGCNGTPITATVTVNPVPTITCPANITVPSAVGVCTVVVTYAPTATGTPAPTFTYSFSGATTGSGSGTGSGSAFTVGVTTVTVTATNPCGTATCSFTVTVTDSQLPVVTAHPANRTVCTGASASFSVTATNTLSYQWQQWNGTAWVNVTGATSATFTVNNAAIAMNTNTFRALVTGLCSTVPSNAATVFVNALPIVSLTSSPLPPSLLPTQTTNLVAQVNPGGGTFVWFKNGAVVAGATGSSLNGLGVNDAGSYWFVYTDPNGCVSTSNTIAVAAAGSSNLYVYPNPNRGTFQVRYYNAANEQLTVNVYDAKGAMVYQKGLTTALPYTSMEVVLPSAHPEGVYMVEVRNSSGKLLGSSKIVVEK